VLDVYRVRDGIDGFVIPAQDIEAFKERLVALYKNKSMRQEIGRQARKQAHKFTWQHYGRSIIEVYREIAKRSGLQV
jgi:glycosyltransferase involved in cell wall biosynthesis